MIWGKCIFQKKVQTGEDALGNPVFRWDDDKATVARHTPWTNEQIMIEGREVTSNEQQFAIPEPIGRLKQYEDCRFIFDEETYDITKMTDHGPRYTVVQGKVYKR